MRGECKTPGGKLVGIDVRVDSGGLVTGCTLDGDFFIEGDEGRAQALIEAICRALVQGSEVAGVLGAFPDVRLVGTGATQIETAFRRALASAGAGDSLRFSSLDAGRAAGISEVADVAHADEGCEVQWRRNRWNALHPRVVVDEPRSPEEQMSIDYEWARCVAEGSMPATLRFWQWSGPAVVVGRYQSVADEVDMDVAREEGFAVVRRCTGGGVMFVEPKNVITYSLYAPRDFVGGVDVEGSYKLCDQWLVDALRGLGLGVRFGGLNDIVSDQGKIAGAAQRRFPPIGSGPGSVLHHDMLSYDTDVVKMGRMLRVSKEKMSDKAVKSARKRVDSLHLHTQFDRRGMLDWLVACASKAL